MPWIVEIGDEFLPEFNELDEQVRTEILAHSALASAIRAAIRATSR